MSAYPDDQTIAPWRAPLMRWWRGTSVATGAELRQSLVVPLLALAVPALLLLLSGVLAGVPADAGTVERGVSVGGVDIGGQSRVAAVGALETRFAAWQAVPLNVRVGDQTWQVSPADLGIELDAERTVERALGVGRGSFVGAGAERIAAHTRGIDVEPVVSFDTQALMNELYALGASEMIAPADARFVIENGQLAVMPSSEGVGIDAGDTARSLQAAISSFSHGPIDAPIVTIEPDVSTRELAHVGNAALEAMAEPLLISDNGTWWQITPEAVAAVLTARDEELAVNSLALANLLGTLAPSIDRPATPAEVVHNGDATFSIKHEAVSRELDLDASATAVARELLDGERQAMLVVVEEPPAITAETVKPLAEKANEIAARGMIVSWGDGEQQLDPAGFAATLRFDLANQTVTFDQGALFALLEPIAHGVNRAPSGYRWKDWQVVAPEGALPGRLVDINASIGQITTKALAGEGRVDLVIQMEQDPAKSTAGIVINDLLGTASTYYGSSSYNRATNVEVAAAALDGALIQPGGTFSFNNAIGGSTTLDDGYMMGYGIITGADGTPTTVPSVAGGICQVATTTFQAAFWSGMPIGTRSWHLYWIPNYGDGPGGLTGLDATVDPDYGLDLTFHNPTSNWLAINAVADGEWITVELWGTATGWTVDVADPIIENVVKADQRMHKQKSAELPTGQEVVVEHAQDGFTATIRRTVTAADGTLIDDTAFTSYYLPARNVTLVGTGGGETGGDTIVEEPVVEETPTEEPVVEEPEPEPTEEPTEVPIEEPTEVPVVEETPTEEPIVEDPDSQATEPADDEVPVEATPSE